MFPWNNNSSFDPFSNINENDFQKMLDQWMKHTFPDYLNTTKQQKNTDEKPPQMDQAAVFETHDFIYIRLPIQKEENLDHLKIYYSINKCMISGLSEDADPYTIILPAIVKKKGATAIYRDQILEIKIPKSIDWQLSEIDVDKKN